MVRQQTVEEIQEQQQFEATKPAEKFNALDDVLWQEVFRTEDTSIYQVNE